MRTIKAKKLTEAEIHEYGSYYDLLNPQGHTLGNFYHDHVLYPVSGNMPIGFSTLVVQKEEKMTIRAAEYHNLTGEIILPLDGDIIVHVAPPSTKPVPELTEAFFVPKGTVLRLNVGVWHLAPFSVKEEQVHIMIALPERTYLSDCIVVNYETEQQIEIENY